MEANNRKISLNVLVNQILSKYAEWDCNALHAGFFPVTKGLIAMLVERLREGEIEDLAKKVVKNEFKDMLLLFRNELDVDSKIDLIKTRARVSGFQFRSDVRGKNYSVIVKHDLGRKWSVYMANRYRAIFEVIGLSDSDFDTSDNTIVFRINTGSR